MRLEHVGEVIVEAWVDVIAEQTLCRVEVSLTLGIVFFKRFLRRFMIFFILFIKGFPPYRILFIRNTSVIVRILIIISYMRSIWTYCAWRAVWVLTEMTLLISISLISKAGWGEVENEDWGRASAEADWELNGRLISIRSRCSSYITRKAIRYNVDESHSLILYKVRRVGVRNSQ